MHRHLPCCAPAQLPILHPCHCLHGLPCRCRAVSSGILQLSQLRRLQLSGDLLLQPLHQLPGCCPHLTSLLLQQPLELQPRKRSNRHQETPQQQQQFEVAKLLAQLPQLQQLSLMAQDSQHVMDAADKSDARLLLKLQQALQGSAGAAAAAPPLQFVLGVLCGQQAAAEALAEALKNPRCGQ